MTIQDLQQRAMALRKKYAQLELKRYGKEWTSAQLAEGFVGDVGDFMKLVMAKEGVRNISDVDAKLAHELSDCLWSILVLADAYHIDLSESFLQTMSSLEQHIDEKLSEAT